MFCKNCGMPMNPNQAVCIRCGVETGKGEHFCSNCGAPVPPNAKACMTCGFATKKPLNGHEKVEVAIVCFFLGGIGIHNFMMNENKKGIFKIATCLLCGISCIFALIDFVKILTDSYEVDPEKLI